MDFFTQQDKARRNTGWLVFLFVMAVLTLVLLTNLLIALTVWFMTQDDTLNRGVSVIAQTDSRTIASLFSWKLFGLISLGVAGAVLCAVAYKWLQLGSGGKAVAESLGGRQISPDTQDPNERMALNVVEEMALASGMPVPPVYLLEEEAGINAFAAGNSPADAVIGVTAGCIRHFKRDELQGVIAHEFSHILNGDMRLNLRLMALLHGIVFIGLVGELLARGHSNRRSDGRIAGLGLALIALGWLGTFFGSLIRAAVSRQREFLADASAVQFTRNPKGIANALKLIGAYSAGSEIGNQRRSEVSHLFFGQVVSKMSSLYATHPPLVDRILRLDPNWDGNYLYRSPKTREQKQAEDEQAMEVKKEEIFQQAVLTGAVLSTGNDPGEAFAAGDLDQIRLEIDELHPTLAEHARNPLGAVVVCCGLLMHRPSDLQQQQIELIRQSGFQGAADSVMQILPLITTLQPGNRLPLMEMLLPALKTMSAAQYQQFKRLLLQLIRVDKQTELFEWCLFQIVRHYLAADFEPQKPRRPRHSELAQISDSYRLVLSLLAHYGHDQAEDAERAFNRGASAAGLYNIELLAEAECDLDSFMQAVRELADVYPLLKPRLLTGLRKCAEHDGQITPLEREVITSIAAVMDTPLPQFDSLVR
ncbi:M48 family metallopeptidase [Neptuniibacter halophilus]|uniref:M48 family metallopeptidase n=1 Tax=Neptuniibacter halophilus TaxID=651666 RepID=UPI0025740C58|nr:M48 family metallopeptidase [Neptuniibacter halophilus]